MIDEFRAAFQELIDASVATDPERFPPAVQRVYHLASHVPPEERELALEALGPFLGGGHTAPGVTADLAVVAGAFVEMGAGAGPAGIEVVRLMRSVGQGAAVFLYAWERTGGGRPPDPDAVTAACEERVAAELGETAPTATACWWTVGRYGLAAKTMLSEAEVRSAVRADAELRAELVAIANQLSGVLPQFGEIRALLRMAEATSALVLERASGRGFRVLFDGIGDNFHLHTLLADALIGAEGRGLAGERPDPRWTAAFRNAAPDPQARVVHGWWNLTALDGSWVWNEGVPADIPTVDGERLLVLEPQPFHRSWNAGRRHPRVTGWLEVEEEVSADEAATWWRRTAPAPTGPRALQDAAEQPQEPREAPGPDPAPAERPEQSERLEGPVFATQRPASADDEPGAEPQPRRPEPGGRDPLPPGPEGDASPWQPHETDVPAGSAPASAAVGHGPQRPGIGDADEWRPQDTRDTDGYALAGGGPHPDGVDGGAQPHPGQAPGPAAEPPQDGERPGEAPIAPAGGPAPQRQGPPAVSGLFGVPGPHAEDAGEGAARGYGTQDGPSPAPMGDRTGTEAPEPVGPAPGPPEDGGTYRDALGTGAGEFHGAPAADRGSPAEHPATENGAPADDPRPSEAHYGHGAPATDSPPPRPIPSRNGTAGSSRATGEPTHAAAPPAAADSAGEYPSVRPGLGSGTQEPASFPSGAPGGDDRRPAPEEAGRPAQDTSARPGGPWPDSAMEMSAPTTVMPAIVDLEDNGQPPGPGERPAAEPYPPPIPESEAEPESATAHGGPGDEPEPDRGSGAGEPASEQAEADADSEENGAREQAQAPEEPVEENSPDPQRSDRLPPLPKGVSDSSAWGPRWL